MQQYNTDYDDIVLRLSGFEGYYLRITDEGSSFQANGIFDQILSTFRFIE